MTPLYTSALGSLYQGHALDVLRTLPAGSVQCCVTSPPYWGLRDYGVNGQIGLEPTPEAYIDRLCEVIAELWRVLANDGTLWLNLGDSYSSYVTKRGVWDPAGTKQAANPGSLTAPSRSVADLGPKQLVGIPWRVAFALQDMGWILRSEIIWHKPNPMPESVKDRPTSAHEHLFLLSKRTRYYYDAEAVREPVSGDPCAPRNRWDTKDYLIPGQKRLSRAEDADQHRPNRHPRPGIDTRDGNHGTGGIPRGKGNAPNETYSRNLRDVWTIPTYPCAEAHFATFPPRLVRPCILAGAGPGDTVIDPFFGFGTTGLVARNLGRRWIGIDLNPDYCALALRRIKVNEPRLTDMLLEVAP